MDDGDQWFSNPPDTLEDMHRAAVRVLKTTGRPQYVHLRPAGEPCGRGDCYVLRWQP